MKIVARIGETPAALRRRALFRANSGETPQPDQPADLLLENGGRMLTENFERIILEQP